MQENKEYRAPEIEWIPLYDGTDGEKVLFESTGLETNDYDLGNGAWW